MNIVLVNTKLLKKVNKNILAISNVIVHDSRPRAPSGTTERNYHQSEMKSLARTMYDCTHPTDPNQTKCMLLGLYFPTHKIICSHIISLRNRNALARLGLPDESIWDAKNGLLLFEPFESKFEGLEIVSCIWLSELSI